jgi:superfamily II DNA/RNA helicase
MDKLAEIVVDFLNGNATSQIMVFCSSRKIVADIVDRLNSASPIVRCSGFIGQASSADSKGLNQGLQLRVLEDFRRGLYNVLVSTSVGEEGLDLGEVDFAICYDVQKSPIRTIQRMGRTGRRRDGQVLFLLSESTQTVLKDAETAQDNISNLICRRRNDFAFYQSPRMNPEQFTVEFRSIEPERVPAPDQNDPRESKRTTLLHSEREDMERKHGKFLRHPGLSLSKYLQFQTSTVSLTDISFAAESTILGELVTQMAGNDRHTPHGNPESVFAISQPSHSNPSNESIPSPPRPLPSPFESERDSTPAVSPFRGSFRVAAMLGIDVSSSNSSDDTGLPQPMAFDDEEGGAPLPDLDDSGSAMEETSSFASDSSSAADYASTDDEAPPAVSAPLLRESYLSDFDFSTSDR